ncbi:MAG: hypothetical protein V1649_02515, partial [Patescibacteria group bacterium]
MNQFLNKKIIFLFAFAIFFCAIAFQANASFNEQINYQGKLTDSSNIAVSDGAKCLKFRLMTAETGGTELWTEVWATSTEQATTTSGLFSVMLGKQTSLSSVDFNQTSLYLETQFDPGCDGTYEEVFSPRKRLGAVPAAFEAKKLGGKTEAQFATLAENETISGQWTFSATTTLATTTISKLTVTGTSSLGIIDTGTWQGTAIADAYVADNITLTNLTQITNRGISDTTGTLIETRGGTGLVSYTTGDVIFATTTNTLAKLGIGSEGQVLTVSSGKPNWQASAGGGGGWTDGGTDVYLTTATDLVGIGATSTAKLTVSASTTAANLLVNQTGTGLIADFQDNGTSVFTILDGGNVGIGTSAPQQKLTLSSGFNFAQEMAVPTGVTTATTTGGTLPAGTYYFKVVSSDGIGTTIGSSEVSRTILASEAINISWTAVTGASSYRVYGNTQGAQNHYFTTTATTYTYATSTGSTAGTVPSVTTAYINKLTSSGNSWLLGGNVGIGTSAPATLFSVATTTNIFNVLSSGNVGIGTSAPSEKLEVVGNIISKGTNWTIRTSAVDNQWLSVTYGNGLFVAVANTGTGNRVMTSPDGINWTIRTTPANNDWLSVTYGNGLFVAVAATGVGNRVMTSPDGITWTIRTSPADNFWFSVTYGNGLFVAVAATGVGNRVMTSPDGINWTIRTTPANNDWQSVTYGNGLFVAVAENGVGNRVMTSPDGINWTIRTTPADNNWQSVTYGNGLFVAVAYSGTGNRVMTSGKQDLISVSHNNIYQGGMNIFGNVGIGTSAPVEKLHLQNGTLLIDNPSNPTLTGTLGTTYARGVYVSGKYAYVADGASGLRIIDTSVPSAPTLTGSLATTNAQNVYVSGKYAYVADYPFGLRIIDISNPSSPTLTGTLATNSAQGIYVSGKYAYVADGSSGLKIINISNPFSPTLTGTLATTLARNVYVSGKYAYVADQASGLRIIDISNPSSPTLTGTLATANAFSVYVSGKYAYVADYDSGLRIINISNPSSPTLTGTLGTTYARGVYVSGKYAYMADQASGLRIIDISNPSSPTLTGTLVTTYALGVYVSGKYAYVADSDSGLKIIDIKGADISSAKIGNIETNDITVLENIDIGNNLYVRNGLNVGSGGIYSQGETSVYASSSASALTVSQTGTGNIVDFKDNGSLVFKIADGGEATGYRNFNLVGGNLILTSAPVPGAPSGVVSASGGSIADGTYYYVLTSTNANGETTKGA